MKKEMPSKDQSGGDVSPLWCARQRGCGVDWIYRCLALGTLKATKEGKRWRIPRDAAEEFVKRGQDNQKSNQEGGCQ